MEHYVCVAGRTTCFLSEPIDQKYIETAQGFCRLRHTCTDLRQAVDEANLALPDAWNRIRKKAEWLGGALFGSTGREPPSIYRARRSGVRHQAVGSDCWARELDCVLPYARYTNNVEPDHYTKPDSNSIWALDFLSDASKATLKGEQKHRLKTGGISSASDVHASNSSASDYEARLTLVSLESR